MTSPGVRTSAEYQASVAVASQLRTQQRRRRLVQFAMHGALALGGVFILMPFLIMLRTSFTPESDILGGSAFPATMTLENYRIAWTEIDMLHYYKNGLIVAGSLFVAQVAVCAPAAFALARLRFRGSTLTLWVVIFAIVLPSQVIAIPVYVMLNYAGLLNTYSSQILPFVGSAFGIFLFRQYFLTIPREIFDAARMDGAGLWRTVWLVAMPLAKPVIVAFAIFSLVYHWNDFFWPSMVLHNDSVATVPWGLAAFADVEGLRVYGAEQAGAMLAILPMMVVYLLVSKSIVKGVALTSHE